MLQGRAAPALRISLSESEPIAIAMAIREVEEAAGIEAGSFVLFDAAAAVSMLLKSEECPVIECLSDVFCKH